MNTHCLNRDLNIIACLLLNSNSKKKSGDLNIGLRKRTTVRYP